VVLLAPLVAFVGCRRRLSGRTARGL